MKRIRLGQLGIGHNHAEGHMEAFRRHPELYEIVGYTETDEAWIRRRGTLPCYAGVPRLSVEELLEKEQCNSCGNRCGNDPSGGKALH